MTVPLQRPAPTSVHAEAWALVERAQAGDLAAFGELYAEHRDAIFRYVRFRTGSVQLAEDLTSDVFVRALRNLSRVTYQGSAIGAWLVTIARNLLADHYKSGRYRLEVTTGDVLDADAADENRGPDDLAVAGLISARVRAALTGLSEEQRQCLIHRFYRGLSVAETAVAMGRNDGAVKALQYRAVRALHRTAPHLLEMR